MFDVVCPNRVAAALGFRVLFSSIYMAAVSAELPFGSSALTDGQGGSNLRNYSSLAETVGCRLFNPDGGHMGANDNMEVYSKA